jgi:hypothetical protein
LDFESSAIRFQQIDIDSYGETSKERISFKIFGLTMEGISVVCSIDDYFPYFYIPNMYPQYKEFIHQLTSYLRVSSLLFVGLLQKGRIRQFDHKFGAN